MLSRASLSFVNWILMHGEQVYDHHRHGAAHQTKCTMSIFKVTVQHHVTSMTGNPSAPYRYRSGPRGASETPRPGQHSCFSGAIIGTYLLEPLIYTRPNRETSYKSRPWLVLPIKGEAHRLHRSNPIPQPSCLHPGRQKSRMCLTSIQ